MFFQHLFQGGMYDPALGQVLASNPESIIPQLSQQGVMPPTLPPNDPMVTQPDTSRPLPVPPGVGTSTPWLTGQPASATYGQPLPKRTSPNVPPVPPYSNPLQGATAADADQGYDPGTPSPDAPMPTPRPQPGSPLDIRSRAQMNPQASAQAAADPQKKQNDLLKAMQGLKAPPPPTAQTVRTPEAPARGNALPNNQAMVQMLLAAMGGNAGQVNPLSLQSALGGPRR